MVVIVVVVVVEKSQANRGQRAVGMMGMVWAHKVLFSATRDGEAACLLLLFVVLLRFLAAAFFFLLLCGL